MQNISFEIREKNDYLTILTILVFFSFPVKLNILLLFLRDGYEEMFQYSIWNIVMILCIYIKL